MRRQRRGSVVVAVVVVVATTAELLGATRVGVLVGSSLVGLVGRIVAVLEVFATILAVLDRKGFGNIDDERARTNSGMELLSVDDDRLAIGAREMVALIEESTRSALVVLGVTHGARVLVTTAVIGARRVEANRLGVVKRALELAQVVGLGERSLFAWLGARWQTVDGVEDLWTEAVPLTHD